MPQFRGDVSAILLASAEALAWLATDADSIANYAADGGGGVISALHAKCRHLVAVLAAVSSPRDEFTAAVSAAEKKLKKGRCLNDVRNNFVSVDQCPRIHATSLTELHYSVRRWGYH